jgi:hypothetical protein
LKFSEKEIQTMKIIVKKIQDLQNEEKLRNRNRRKAQLKGKTITKVIQKKRKPVREARKVTKKRSSIR